MVFAGKFVLLLCCNKCCLERRLYNIQINSYKRCVISVHVNAGLCGIVFVNLGEYWCFSAVVFCISCSRIDYHPDYQKITLCKSGFPGKYSRIMNFNPLKGGQHAPE